MPANESSEGGPRPLRLWSQLCRAAEIVAEGIVP